MCTEMWIHQWHAGTKCVTKDRGKRECSFPMIHNGKNFGNKCTKEGHHSLWCYTMSGSTTYWGHCPDTNACTGKNNGVSIPILP